MYIINTFFPFTLPNQEQKNTQLFFVETSSLGFWPVKAEQDFCPLWKKNDNSKGNVDCKHWFLKNTGSWWILYRRVCLGKQESLWSSFFIAAIWETGVAQTVSLTDTFVYDPDNTILSDFYRLETFF